MANWWDQYTWSPQDWIAPDYFLDDPVAQSTYVDFIEVDQRLAGDEMAQELFYNCMYNKELSAYDRDMIRIELYDYMSDNYDIDFADVFDWEEYRKWY